jgi:hypothetical protein
MAADYASSLKSRMFLGASSTGCFVAEAARARNPKTMVRHVTFSLGGVCAFRLLRQAGTQTQPLSALPPVV